MLSEEQITLDLHKGAECLEMMFEAVAVARAYATTYQKG